MKKFTLILFGAFFASIFLFAQQKQITLNLNNVTVKEALEVLKTTGGYSYWFDAKDLNVSQKVTINVVNKTIDEVLALLFKGQKVEYKIKDGHIVISKSEEKEIPVQKKNELKKVTGVVLDEKGIPVIGANVMIPGTKIVAVTDINGQFSIEAPSKAKLRISYIGYEPKLEELRINSDMKISLEQIPKGLDEVVVVGYGSQKKQSVVGAIVQTKGSDLERTGVSTSVSQALSGLLPGVTTTTVTGMPGADETRINIRGLSSWNGSNPLVLIDGVNRNLTDIDIGQIESISVLKDASATAVFGVKGAEGVILVTTKRGKEGKAQITFSSSTDFKFISKTLQKMDAYDNFNYQNEILEKQIATNPSSWSWYTPQSILNKYRYPASIEESEMYPNVNWIKEVVKPYAMTQHYDLSISGGTTFAKYFNSLSFLKDDDILNSGQEVGLPYKTGFGFKRYNFRSNLDFNLSKTTLFSINLAASLGEKSGYQLSEFWGAFYGLSPSSFPVRFSEGAFGYNPLQPGQVNPVAAINGSTSGVQKNYNTQIFTDFKLQQDLSFITKGLSLQGVLSYDNKMYSTKTISPTTLLSKNIDRDGKITYSPDAGVNEYSFYPGTGSVNPETFTTGSTSRLLHYQGQINYSRTLYKHNLSALALVSRDETTTGSEFPHYREDWVGRITYGYDDRYFLETNAAYNGSERFSEKYRFGFFPSLGLGWMLSNEKFLKSDWLDKLKLRYSIGTVGSDNFVSERWSYNTQWGTDGNITTFGGVSNGSVGKTYLQYKELVIGNPDLQWEVSRKQNLGIDYSVLNGLISGSLDIFQDDRSNVFMSASQRANNEYAYFGAAPVAANVGKVQNKGFEFEVKFKKEWSGINFWLNYSLTHAINKIIDAENPAFQPSYQKSEGFKIGQPSTFINQPGYTTSWDDMYGSVSFEASNSGRLPGDNSNVDFNGDGIINSLDKARYGYTNLPENTYNITTGADYKGFSLMVQFYGVYNANIDYINIYYFSANQSQPIGYSGVNDYWTPSNPDALYQIGRAGGGGYSTMKGYRGYVLDGSYLRLKNIELAYTLSSNWLKKINMNTVKLSLSGNNLFFWSKLPEDKESGVNIFTNSTNDLYPTIKVINFRLKVTF